jgi:acetoacetyl-CoA synthetase
LDLKPGDRVFYFTTCGWMMWNWLVSGSPAARRCCSTTARRSWPAGAAVRLPTPNGMTVFGTSAKYIDACAKAG